MGLKPRSAQTSEGGLEVRDDWRQFLASHATSVRPGDHRLSPWPPASRAPVPVDCEWWSDDIAEVYGHREFERLVHSTRSSGDWGFWDPEAPMPPDSSLSVTRLGSPIFGACVVAKDSESLWFGDSTFLYRSSEGKELERVCRLEHVNGIACRDGEVWASGYRKLFRSKKGGRFKLFKAPGAPAGLSTGGDSRVWLAYQHQQSACFAYWDDDGEAFCEVFRKDEGLPMMLGPYRDGALGAAYDHLLFLGREGAVRVAVPKKYERIDGAIETLQGTVFALMDGAAYRSTDRGAAWRRCKLPKGSFNCAAQMADGSLLMGGTAVVLSRDDGDTWEVLKSKQKDELRCAIAHGQGAIVGGEHIYGIQLR